MSVGGKVIQVFQFPKSDLMWVNTLDQGDEPCSVLAGGPRAHEISLGDTVWWQGKHCYWTPQSKSEQDVPLDKCSASGIRHPLGEEFTIRYDMKKIADQRKARIVDLTAQRDAALAKLAIAEGALEDIAAHSVEPFTNEHKFFAYINDIARVALEELRKT